MNNIIVQIRYADRPSRCFIMPESEFREYLYLAPDMITSCQQPGMTYEETYSELCNDLIVSFNKIFRERIRFGRSVRIIDRTTKPSYTDPTLDRLEIALWFGNPIVNKLTNIGIADDPAVKGIRIDGAESIDRAITAKQRYIEKLRKTVYGSA